MKKGGKINCKSSVNNWHLWSKTLQPVQESKVDIANFLYH